MTLRHPALRPAWTYGGHRLGSDGHVEGIPTWILHLEECATDWRDAVRLALELPKGDILDVRIPEPMQAELHREGLLAPLVERSRLFEVFLGEKSSLSIRHTMATWGDPMPREVWEVPK